MIPFNAMVAFSFVLSWIGCTSHLHHLMKLNRLGHVKLQLCIGLIQFGYGRIVASVIWFFWFYYYDQLHKLWFINYFSIIDLDDRPINRIEMLEEMNAFRVLIRILSLFAFVFAIVFFIFYQLLSKCEQVNCKWHREQRNTRKNRRLVKLEEEEDLDNIEEEDSLTKTTKCKKTEIKFKDDYKIDLEKKKDTKKEDRKVVYKPLSFFQVSNKQKKKNRNTDKKDENKANKRKSSANIIKFNNNVNHKDKKKIDINEEMV